MNADRLFEALDGSAIRVGDAEWRLQVFGVIESAGRRWVQLELDGSAHRVLTLSLDHSQGPSDAMTTLSHWLANPTRETSNVLQHVA